MAAMLGTCPTSHVLSQTRVIFGQPICLALLAQHASALSLHESMCLRHDTSMLLQSQVNSSMHSCFSELTLFSRSQYSNCKAPSRLKHAQSCWKWQHMFMFPAAQPKHLAQVQLQLSCGGSWAAWAGINLSLLDILLSFSNSCALQSCKHATEATTVHNSKVDKRKQPIVAIILCST